VDIVKDPAVADATKSLLDTFKQSTADSLKGFQDYLDQFRKDTSSALTASKAAQNITPTVNTLTGNQTAYNASLDKSTAAQAAELEKAKADYAALNAANATTQRGIVQKGYNELPAYDAAGNAIADRQMQTVVQNLSRYKLGTGTPTSLGSDESRILAQGAADVMLPLKQSQIARRYDLFGNEANVESGLYGAERNRVASFNPDVAAREFSASQGTAQQEFQSGQVTANTIQNLKERVAQMSYQDAIRFFDLVGVPAQIRQQILGGQISQLGQLAQLNDLSRYRGLSDRLGVNLSQPQYAGFSAPGFPAPSRNPPSSPGNQPAPGLPASNAPKQIGPRGGPDTGPLIPDPSGNGFFDADGNWFPAGSVGTPTYAGNPYSRGSQSNSYYDPASGNYIDRNTGAVTGGNNLQAPSYMGDADLSPLQYA
jgi:hypothetical protein